MLWQQGLGDLRELRGIHCSNVLTHRGFVMTIASTPFGHVFTETRAGIFADRNICLPL